MIFVQYKSVLSIYLRVGSFHLLSNTFETQSEGRVWLFLSVHKTWASTLTVWKSQAFSPFSVKFTSLCCDPSAQLSTPSEFLLPFQNGLKYAGCGNLYGFLHSLFSLLNMPLHTEIRKAVSFHPPTNSVTPNRISSEQKISKEFPQAKVWALSLVPLGWLAYIFLKLYFCFLM